MREEMTVMNKIVAQRGKLTWGEKRNDSHTMRLWTHSQIRNLSIYLGHNLHNKSAKNTYKKYIEWKRTCHNKILIWEDLFRYILRPRRRNNPPCSWPARWNCTRDTCLPNLPIDNLKMKENTILSISTLMCYLAVHCKCKSFNAGKKPPRFHMLWISENSLALIWTSGKPYCVQEVNISHSEKKTLKKFFRLGWWRPMPIL